MKIIQLLKCENDYQWQGRLLGLGDDGITYEVNSAGCWVEFIPGADQSNAMRKALEEADKYLDTNKFTSIGHGSVLHTMFKDALAT